MSCDVRGGREKQGKKEEGDGGEREGPDIDQGEQIHMLLTRRRNGKTRWCDRMSIGNRRRAVNKQVEIEERLKEGKEVISHSCSSSKYLPQQKIRGLHLEYDAAPIYM